MKSPIKENINNFKCLSAVKKLIPRESVVHSFLFFDGKIELSLASDKRFMIAHTNKHAVYEFWRCALVDPVKIATMADFLFPIEDENIFHLLQENWPTYYDPYVRSALFFLLNRCSDTGAISKGKLDLRHYTPRAVGTLKRFNPDNFHIHLDTTETFIEGVKHARDSDYLLLPIGKFSYNFFEHGKSRGFEMTPVDHQQVAGALGEAPHRWVVLYKNHSEVMKLYGDYNITMVDKFGRPTMRPGECEDVVIANF